MESTIWKSVLFPVNIQEIEVPAGAEMLCAREQNEQVCVWYRCNPMAAKEKRTIEICGTGHPAPKGRHLGTASLIEGSLILHVFEKEPNEKS